MPEYRTAPADLQVRRVMSADFEAIADIHCAALPQDLLPRLGRRALAKVFYPWFLNTELFDFITLAGDDTLAGFIVLRNRTPTLRELLPICVKLLPSLVWNCLVHPPGTDAGKIGQPIQGSDGPRLFTLQGNTLSMLRVHQVGGHVLKITLRKDATGLSCSSDSKMAREVGAGDMKTTALGGGKAEVRNARQISSTCKVQSTK